MKSHLITPYLKLVNEQQQMIGKEDDSLGRVVSSAISTEDALPPEELERVQAAVKPLENKSGNA